MKYIKATIYLLIGLIKALFDWIIYLPVAIFTIPIDMWNTALYGRKVKSFVIDDIGNGKIRIELPNGEVIYGEKQDKQSSPKN